MVDLAQRLAQVRRLQAAQHSLPTTQKALASYCQGLLRGALPKRYWVCERGNISRFFRYPLPWFRCQGVAVEWLDRPRLGPAAVRPGGEVGCTAAGQLPGR